uniref:Integral membrane protein n=1 Tax=Streptomyces viridochromogenes TaxID=1938 RepID=G0WV91_STRVR|nr:integral membrane protein [Streptomyces viridochromogenes]
MLVRTFGWSFGVTVVGLVFAAWQWGWEAFGVVLILSVLEISLSFDNAVVNAGILKRMNAFWQRMFLTVGVLIAVFGMRLVFPVVIVAISAEVGPLEAVQLALDDPGRYEDLVTDAHPAIAAFGGMFLLMIFLDFILEDREIKWLGWLERPLAKLGRIDMLSVCVALIALLATALTFATHAHVSTGQADKAGTVLLSGVAGLITYLVVGGLSSYFEDRLEAEEEHEHEEEEKARAEGRTVVALAGRAAFFLFLYLEVLDASFSFDGVIGAFAITNHIFWMALGLGIGAMYVRSLTVYLVRQGTLDDYVYLEHGAHYAIGALAVILLITVQHQISEIITGLIGVVLIAASFLASVRRNRALAAAERLPEGTRGVT